MDAELESLLTRILRENAVPIGDVEGTDEWVEQLRQYGVTADGSQWRFEPEFERLSEAVVRSALSASASGWVSRLDVVPVIDSTNSALMARADQGSIDGMVLTAEIQAAGRGRRGRQWVAPVGGSLALSLGFDHIGSLSSLGGLSLVVGLAVADCLESHGVDGLALKWPNDLLRADGKLAGILVETVQAGPDVRVVIGIGLNLWGAETLSASLARGVADLSDLPVAKRRNALLAGLINTVYRYVRAYQTDGFAPMRQAWEALNAHQDQVIALDLGDRQVQGRMRGVDDHGALLLETVGSNVERYTGGEISLRAPEQTK